jgi:hypothetical protein
MFADTHSLIESKPMHDNHDSPPRDIQLPEGSEVNVLVRLVNGDLMEHTGEHWLSEYRTLAARGFEGKALIHELITDDLGAPPLFVQILENGVEVAKILYR